MQLRQKVMDVKTGSWKEFFKTLKSKRAHLGSEGFNEDAASEPALEGQLRSSTRKRERHLTWGIYTQAEKNGCVLAGLMGLAMGTKGNKQRKRDGIRPSSGNGQKAEGKWANIVLWASPRSLVFIVLFDPDRLLYQWEDWDLESQMQFLIDAQYTSASLHQHCTWCMADFHDHYAE